MSAENYAQGIGFGFAIVALMAGAFFWGYEVRARLAEKLDYFRVTNRQWHEYDDELRASKNHRVPLRAELHQMRQSEK
jgi:hypothetical protein